MTSLLDQPRWTMAAQALVDGCMDLGHDEDRVALLAAVCDGLGDQLYPAFLRVLAIVGQYGDHAAAAAIAGALVHALRTGRLPSGKHQAWGAVSSQPGGSGNLALGGFGRLRRLGPLEFLCVWHAQAEADQAIDATQFQSAARALMDLIDTHPSARRLYCEKLLADVDDPISGALSRPTRAAVRSLAVAWSGGASTFDATASFLAALPAAPGAMSSLSDLQRSSPHPADTRLQRWTR